MITFIHVEKKENTKTNKIQTQGLTFSGIP